MPLERTSFSTYLLRPNAEAEVEKRLFDKGVGLRDGLEGLFVPLPFQSRPPSWLASIRPHLRSTAGIDLFGQSRAGMLHFDAKNVSFGGGRSKFEFCDFVHLEDRVLFFAKIASRSSDCSHLVEQVRRTDELLFGVDGAFRTKLKKTFEKFHKKADRSWLDRRPNRGDWKLCLVSLGKEKKQLPFFAKCGIWRLARSLEQQGHSIFFTSV